MIHLPPDPFQLEVEATSTQLHQDWNHRIDKYGLIRQDEGATV